MKSIIIIKTFLILCCQVTSNNEGNIYEVKNIKDSTEIGTIISNTKYNQGDTIVLKFTKKPNEQPR